MTQIFSSTFPGYTTSATYSITTAPGTSGIQFYNSSVPTYTINNQGTGSLKNALSVEGDADFKGDIKWKGRSLGTLLEKIEDRLCILEPPPEKLEKYQALKKAYEHYKLMEKIIGDD